MKTVHPRLFFTAPNEFIVTDSFETAAPQTITSYLYSDDLIVEESKNTFEFEPTGTSLFAEIIAPKNFAVKVEKKYFDRAGQTGQRGQGRTRGTRR